MSMTMNLTTAGLALRAAEALAESLPTIKALTPSPRERSGSAGIDVSSAVVATFVGASSYDVAMAIVDGSMLAPAAGEATVSLTDLVHGALVGASEVLGDGVLGDQRVEDAASLFDDPDTAVVELLDGTQLAGLFGLRARRASSVSGSASAEDVSARLGRINNVEMALTVEIGRTRMPVRDVLSLEPGAVVELDRSAGAPADILLNGRLIAYGEVVVVDQDYAVRVTQILDTPDLLA
jgi:flagellar motor switch protein FliN/FliY